MTFSYLSCEYKDARALPEVAGQTKSQALQFSSRCVIDVVPAITTMFGDRFRSQASDWRGSSFAPCCIGSAPKGPYGMNAMPLLAV